MLRTMAEEWIEEGRAEGLHDGLLAGIELGRELRFGADGLRLLPEIRKIPDADVLKAIHEGLKTTRSLDELQRVYHRQSAVVGCQTIEIDARSRGLQPAFPWRHPHVTGAAEPRHVADSVTYIPLQQVPCGVAIRIRRGVVDDGRLDRSCL